MKEILLKAMVYSHYIEAEMILILKKACAWDGSYRNSNDRFNAAISL
jgi:hypothetical protein